MLAKIGHKQIHRSWAISWRTNSCPDRIHTASNPPEFKHFYTTHSLAFIYGRRFTGLEA